MSEVDEREVVTDTRSTHRAADSSPVRVFLVGAVVIVVIVAGLLAAIRSFVFPIWEANSEGVRQVATAQAQLSVAMTQEALTPAPAATPAIVVGPQVTAASTPLATSAPAPAVQATGTPAPSVAGPTPVVVASATPNNLPTPTAEQAEEIALAYKNYFDARSEALLNLDPSVLDDVAAGESLAGLQRTIEENRAQGRALQTNVEHEQVFVTGFNGSDAEVADQYRDSSIFVDPVTHNPLPGQVAPASPDVAPLVSVVYHLQRIDGVWKVVSGQRYVPQDNG